jgi:glycosyltransferase involved in cell wall biosynthesis
MENRLHQRSGNPLNTFVESACRVAVLIPCFNEAGSIATVVKGARRRVKSVWIIDDGSRDQTKQIAERAGAVVRRNETNLGKGAALREGLEALLAAGFEWAIVLDGDGQHDPADIPKFIGEIPTGIDLVIGNRMSHAHKMSWLRRHVNQWMSERIGARLGIECPDSQCGFRLIRLGAWSTLRFRSRHYEIESEIIAAFVKAGFRMAFVPIQVALAKRPSHILPVWDSIRWLRWWWS